MSKIKQDNNKKNKLIKRYVLNGHPYLGAENESIQNSKDQLGERVVKKLMMPYENRGHCITADNFFTSFRLIVYLLKIKTTFIGTVKSNKRELPTIVKKNESLYTSSFYENDNGVTLTIYQGTKKRNVLVFSSHHEEISIEGNEKGNKKKPNIIVDYNRTKFGVDSIDQMTRFYNVKAPSRRWPMQVFYNILNLATINAWLLYKIVNKSKISR